MQLYLAHGQDENFSWRRSIQDNQWPAACPVLSSVPTHSPGPSIHARTHALLLVCMYDYIAVSTTTLSEETPRRQNFMVSAHVMYSYAYAAMSVMHTLYVNVNVDIHNLLESYPSTTLTVPENRDSKPRGSTTWKLPSDDCTLLTGPPPVQS